MFTFITHFEKAKILHSRHLLAKILRNAFLVRPYVFLVGPTALIRDLFFYYGFPRKLRAGPHGSCDNQQYLETVLTLHFGFRISWRRARRGLFIFYFGFAQLFMNCNKTKCIPTHHKSVKNSFVVKAV